MRTLFAACALAALLSGCSGPASCQSACQRMRECAEENALTFDEPKCAQFCQDHRGALCADNGDPAANAAALECFTGLSCGGSEFEARWNECAALCPHDGSCGRSGC